jgi:hypothetical protein
MQEGGSEYVKAEPQNQQFRSLVEELKRTKKN